MPKRRNGYDSRLASKSRSSELKFNYKKYEPNNSLHNKHHDVENDITACGDITFVPLRSGPMINLHEI